MKKALFSLLLAIIAVDGSAQDKLEGVWGLPFGSTKAATKKLIDLKHEIHPKREVEQVIEYTHYPFEGYDAEYMRLSYHEDKLYLGIFKIKPRSESNILEEYHALVDMFEKKYGKADVAVEDYEAPYQKGGGSELMAIRQGRADIGTIWYFPKGESKDPQGKIYIKLGGDMALSLMFSEMFTFNALAETRQKNISEGNK